MGTFYNILGSIMLSASVAAFMSTADSAMHATSSCLTLDFFYPCLQTRIEDEGRRDFIASAIGYLMSTLVAIFALWASQNDIPFGALLTIQNALLMVLTPGYCLGLCWKQTKTYAVLIGMVFSLVFTVSWQCLPSHGFDLPCQPSGYEWYGPIPYVHPSIFCLLINTIVVVVLSLIPGFPDSAIGMDRVVYPESDPKSSTFPMQLVAMDISQTGGPEVRPWYGKQRILFFAGLNLSWFLVPWYWAKDFSDDKPIEPIGDGPHFYPGWLITVILSCSCSPSSSSPWWSTTGVLKTTS